MVLYILVQRISHVFYSFKIYLIEGKKFNAEITIRNKILCIHVYYFQARL